MKFPRDSCRFQRGSLRAGMGADTNSKASRIGQLLASPAENAEPDTGSSSEFVSGMDRKSPEDETPDRFLSSRNPRLSKRVFPKT